MESQRVSPPAAENAQRRELIGFTGRYGDWETGLMYFRARMYDAALGRFINRDPKGYVNGMGLYGAYLVPNGLDPKGTEVTPCDCAAIGNWIKSQERADNFWLTAIASGWGMLETLQELKAKGFKDAGTGGTGAVGRGATAPPAIRNAINECESWWYVPGRVGMSFMGLVLGGIDDMISGQDDGSSRTATLYQLQEWSVNQMLLAKLKAIAKECADKAAQDPCFRSTPCAK